MRACVVVFVVVAVALSACVSERTSQSREVRPMNIDEFWEIIDHVHRESAGEMDRKCALLQAELDRRTADEVHGFFTRFDTLHDEAYTWPLWGAAYVINGGCGDDSFSDFRATLISMGRADFEKALRDPDSLADLPGVGEQMFYEGFQYVASAVYEKKTGHDPVRSAEAPSDPAGEPWDEDEVNSMFPRLASRFPQ